jgi:peroxiredoxin
MLAPGSQAPRFTLHDLEGAPHSLADLLAEGPVLLAFFKISCPVCQMTMPLLARLPRQKIFAISQDEAPATRRFEDRFGVSLPTLLDLEEDGYPVSNAFGVTHVPSLFLIEPDGKISFATEGFVKSDLESLGLAFRQDEAVPAWKAG